jgi:glycosyltransferase involved in cell wall biosynthesis
VKILVATEQWFPDYAGGVGRVAEQTSRALVGRGHDVVVIAPSSDGRNAQDALPGVDVRRVLRRGWLPKTFTDAGEVARAVRRLGLGDADVAVAHHPTSVVGIARAAPNVPIAYVFHASALREARQRRARGVGPAQSVRSHIVEPELRRLERAAARRSERVLVLSEFSRELFGEDHPARASRVEIVGGGVDTRVFRPAEDREALRRRLGIAPEERILVTVRRLVHRTGVDLLLDALAQPSLRDSRTRAVIIGEGELRPALERRRDALGLGMRAQLLGRLPDDEVRDWYRAADVVVLPTIAYEGFGISTAEALACGTPVVGTPVGATPEILRPLEPGLIARAADPAALADAVWSVLERLGPDLRGRCRTYAEDSLSWGRVILRWEHSITSLKSAPSDA